MEILKRNLGLMLFLVISLMTAAALIVFTKQHADAVRKSQNEFEEVKNFVSSLRQQKIAITEENYQTARKNSELASKKLKELRKTLVERSLLETEPMSSVQFKNHLVSKTREMLKMLTQSNVRVAEAATGFSFSAPLQSSTLPDQTVEVPVLSRQLLMAEELVRLISDSGVRELLDMQRVAGMGSVELEEYTVTRFELQVVGNLSSVKQFITDLQLNSKYFLYIPSVSIVADSDINQENLKSPYEMTSKDSNRRNSSVSRTPAIPTDMMMAGTDRGVARFPGETGEDEKQEMLRLPKIDRSVVFRDNVTAEIPVHFIEFTKSR
jgi:hypothetical protein